MITKGQVESILKLNGVSPTAADEHIRSVLLSARFNKDEVDAALMVLRENVSTHEARVDGLHKVFRTQESLKPQEISNLLGIEVDIADTIEARGKARKISTLQYIIIWIVSILVAMTGVLLYMHIHHIGFFHPSSNVSLLWISQ